MNELKILPFLISMIFSCNTQDSQQHTNSVQNDSIIGGECDGCELMYIEMPKQMDHIDTSIAWDAVGTQKLMLTGTVYKIDGRTPAPEVVIYYWHTNSDGLYASTNNHKAVNHGDLRGWIKTDTLGRYTINTARPSPYPNETLPAHIHLAIKEPDLPNEYYIEDVVFDDDLLLVPHLKKYPPINRCGSGIVRILVQNDIQIAEHDIVLGLNIPNYPQNTSHLANDSGLSIGEDQPSFIPYHVYGPDQNTSTCPVCKYGRYHGIIFYADYPYEKNEMRTWMQFLEEESQRRNKYLKAYIVFNTKAPVKDKKITAEIQQMGKALNLQKTAITVVPSWEDLNTEIHLNKIDHRAKNTIIIYKHRSIVDKYVDVLPSPKNMSKIRQSLDQSNQWFELDDKNGH